MNVLGKSKVRAIDQFTLTSLLLAIFYSNYVFAQFFSCPAGKLCVKPKPNEWTYTLCVHNGSITADRAACEVSGGVYMGALGGCSGSRLPNSDSEVAEWAVAIAQKMVPEGEECQITQTIGWGEDVGAQNCGNGGPIYDSGNLIVDNQYIEVGNCNQYFSARKNRVLDCPPGSGYQRDSAGYLICSISADFSCSVGNPIMPLAGNKVQREVDFQLPGILLERFYNSNSSLIPYNANESSDLYFGTHGNYWRTNFDYRFYTLEQGGEVSGYALSTPNGFVQIYDEQFLPKTDMYQAGQLTRIGNEFIYQYNNFELRFSWAHQLISMTVGNVSYVLTYTSETEFKAPVNSQGKFIAGELPIGYLISVDTSARNLFTFDYDQKGRMAFSYSGGQHVSYEYDEMDNLVKVTKSSGEHRNYHYENIDFPAALTGITDERGIRYVTWTYDSYGRANSSVHAETKEKTFIDYSQSNSSVNPFSEVVNALGKRANYYFDVIGGVRKLNRIEGQPSTNCAAANQYKSYYPNATLQTQTDWEGNVTYFERDTLGRTIKKTEALKWPGTPQYGLNVDASTLQTTANTKITQTCWHTTHNKPERIIEPSNVTVFEYFDNGKLKNKKVEAHSEENSVCP